ncbi:MAG: hypothetical protein ABSD20_05075 [Terriglobales bacterium]|jgi:hypothetical protein
MTMLNVISAEAIPAVNSEVIEKTNTRREHWIRYYCPALVIMGSVLYVIHSWMMIA